MMPAAREIHEIADRFGAAGPVVDPSDPMATAGLFRAAHFQAGGDSALFHWRGEFYAWKAAAYRPVLDDELRSMIWRYLSGSLRHGKDGLVPVKPASAMVDAVLDALGAVAELPRETESRAWIDDPPKGTPRGGLVAVANGLLHLDSRILHPANPRFFNTSASPVAYDPAASATGWTAFLDEIFCGDAESVSLLQEWFGYVLSSRTDLQKILLLIGPTRSGKSTLARIAAALLGPDAVAGPSLASFASPFGIQGLLGKPLA
ncbi:MAG: NTP-binding protein, partial [Alphaproteobacteria bacterium]|nr:NTP-binding protein [Alphaproteobacteria bacterium]